MFLLYVLCANMFVLELYIFALCFYAALVSGEDCSEKEHPNLDVLKGDRVGLETLALGAGVASAASSVVGAAKTVVGAAGDAETVLGAAGNAVSLKKQLSEE